MEFDGYDEYGNVTPAMVTIACYDIPHIWHMLIANLEMNSYN